MNLSLEKVYLDNFHSINSAKFAPFAGFNMPINYSAGIINEHLHTRKFTSVFDVSHMGKILISSTNYNLNTLEKFIPIDLFNLNFGNSSYTFILNKDGGIIDDIIISKIKIKETDYIFIVYNASRKQKVEKILIEKLDNYEILSNHSLLAIQGPSSENILSNFFDKIHKLFFMQLDVFNYQNNNIIVSRSGYTGEDGFELCLPNNIVNEFIQTIIKYENVQLSGLGARDSLRLEAGLSLYGNELNENITPIEADLSWAISNQRLKKGNFNGYEKILDQINNGVKKKKVGIMSIDRFILRSKMKIFNEKKEVLGLITSGCFSPCLKKSIGIAYINKSIIKKEEKLFCFAKNNLQKVELNSLPFIKHNYRRKNDE